MMVQKGMFLLNNEVPILSHRRLQSKRLSVDFSISHCCLRIILDFMTLLFIIVL